MESQVVGKNLIVKRGHKLGEQDILPSDTTDPLKKWDKKLPFVGNQNHISMVEDSQLDCKVVQLLDYNQQCYIDYAVPPEESKKTAKSGFVCIVKMLQKPFGIDLSIMDSSQMRKRIRLSTEVDTAIAKNFNSMFPLKFENNKEWHYLYVNLDKLTKMAFETTYVRTLKIRIHPTCQLYRIQFTSKPKDGENILI